MYTAIYALDKIKSLSDKTHAAGAGVEYNNAAMIYFPLKMYLSAV